MVKIHYCPKCKKATREHFFRKVYCKKCNSEFEIINVSRSLYFFVQFFFLITGFIFLFSAFILIDPRERIYESMGVAFMGISMWLFTLLFQMMDSKDMEGRAEQQIMNRELQEAEEGPGRSPFRARPELSKPSTSRPDRVFGAGSREPLSSVKPKGEPEPRVVRIRRALPRQFEPEEKPMSAKPSGSRPSKPIVIRDMSNLFDESEDEGD